MLTGIFSTLLIPETMGKTLEELSNEDQEGFVQGMIYILPFRCGLLSDLLASIGVNELRVNKDGILVTDS
jgi:hypothetical protein